MFAQAALCLSGRACPGLENPVAIIYPEYRYSIEKRTESNADSCHILRIQIQLTVLFYFFVLTE